MYNILLLINKYGWLVQGDSVPKKKKKVTTG